MSRDLDAILAALSGRFEILDLLGQGGMGVVYRARQRGLNREVALKIASVSVPDAAARFRAEAQALARLDHPAIIPLYEADLSGDTPYFVMPVVVGHSLTEIIATGNLSQARALALAQQVAAGLAHAHQRGIVHRDVKPDNIMVTPEGDARLADFGIARWTTDRPEGVPATAPGTVLGSPPYMAPEQIRGSGVGPATDVYALGATLYHMLTGRPPFDHADLMPLLQAHLKELPEPPSCHAAGISPALDALVLSLLAKDPRLRPADGQAVVAALDALIRPAPLERAPAVRPAVATRKVRPLQSRHPWSAVLPVLAFAAGALAWSSYRHAPPPLAPSSSVDPSPSTSRSALHERGRARVERLLPLLEVPIIVSAASNPGLTTNPVAFDAVIPPPPPEGYRLELALRAPARGIAAVLTGAGPEARELVGQERDGFTRFAANVQPKAGLNSYRWQLIHAPGRQPQVDHIVFKPLGLAPEPRLEEPPHLELVGEAGRLEKSARDAWTRKDLPRAISDAAGVLRLKPEADSVRALLGECHHRRHQTGEAIRELDRCVATRPGWAWPWSDLGVTLADAGRDLEARAIHVHTLRLDPVRMWFWIHLARAELRLNKYDAALDHVRFAVECDPKSSDARTELAALLEGSPAHR